jgi:hypothetical protein
MNRGHLVKLLYGSSLAKTNEEGNASLSNGLQKLFRSRPSPSSPTFRLLLSRHHFRRHLLHHALALSSSLHTPTPRLNTVSTYLD